VRRQVWDVNIIETAEVDYYDQGTTEFVDALTKNITVRIANISG
jgi:N-acyl-L-homoserine lactone synthetase